MDGNTREFAGIVNGVDVSTVRDMNDEPVATVDPRLDVDMLRGGSLVGLRFTEDVDEARALVGRRVLVTVTVLDGEG